MRYVLIFLLLTACGLNDGDDSESISIITGYNAASTGNTIYIPSAGLEDETECETGNAFRMYAVVDDANTELTTNGLAVVTYSRKLRIILGTSEEIADQCVTLTGVQGTAACTNWDDDNNFTMYVSPEHNCRIWGHEARHVLHKEYH